MTIKIIAEAATNHNGDIGLAKEMVYAAKEAGADYIKFQSWQIKNMDPNNDAYVLMKNKELSDDAHFTLIKECRKAKIKFLTTCFDIHRVDFLSGLGLKAIKVASTDVGSKRMLAMLRNKFETIILSTGMAFEEDIRQAAQILMPGDFYLLHCVSIYPTPFEKANLLRMEWLKRFTPKIGYSDHTHGTHAAKIAICMGAQIVEKHFTLKRDPKNIFSNISALPQEIKEISCFSKNYLAMLGEENPLLSEEEIESRKKYIGRWGDNA